MAFGHNDGVGKLKARKAADKRSRKKKTAVREQAGSSEDAAESSAAITDPPRAGKSAPHSASHSEASAKAAATKHATPRPARRTASGSKSKSGHGCGGCDTGCVVEDPIEVAKRTMKGSVPAIVDAMVKKAKQGSCPHAKTLLEMTGAKFMFHDGPETHAAGESWAKLVLKRMKQAERKKVSVKPADSNVC